MALFADEIEVAHLPKYKSCEILASSPGYMPSSITTAFQKDSPFFQIYNYVFDVLRERGTFDKIMSKYEIKRQSKCGPFLPSPTDLFAI